MQIMTVSLHLDTSFVWRALSTEYTQVVNLCNMSNELVHSESASFAGDDDTICHDPSCCCLYSAQGA